MSAPNVQASDEDRPPPSGPSSSQRADHQQQRLSPSVVGSVYPALQNLQRISHGHVPLSQPSTTTGGAAVATTTTASSTSATASSNPGRSSRHSGSPHHPSPPLSVHPPPGPSIVSHHVLPTYRQASGSGDGPSPSGHPLGSSSDHPPHYRLESSLPDILHSHMVPRVPPARPNQHRQHRNRNRGSRSGDAGGGSSRDNHNRHRGHSERSVGRQRRRSRTQSTSSNPTQEGTCKEPCVKCVVTVTSFRWVLVVLSVLGVFCVVTGIVLAALHAAGNSFLFLAIMFIGLGILLVVVVGVGWKCTPRGHEPLHALFGIGNFRQGQTRERRHRRHRNRDGSWFGGIMYPEFQYRRPPPSYAASMQDYQNSQVMQDQNNPAPVPNIHPGNSGSLPSSPPPSYRSRASTAHSGIHIAFPPPDGDHPSSRPPTYRSRAPSRRPSLPREETSATGEISGGGPADVCFTGSSNIHVSITDETVGPGSQGRPLTPTSSRNPVTMQIVTMPIIGSSDTDSHSWSAPTSNTQSAPPPSTSHTTSSPTMSQSHTSTPSHRARIPSLHQRMASEDRHILEQTLQSLEDHMNESEGITNQGASFDEQDQSTDSINTHL